MRRISVLGSTGSIGRNTMEVVRRFPDRFRVVGLSAYSNIGLLEEQIRTFRPAVAAVFNEAAAADLRKREMPVEILSGEEGLRRVATIEDADLVVSAIVGSAGLVPTLSAIDAGKDVALAAKESLVMAGSVVMGSALRNGVKVIPVDSEHSAIFQCLAGREKSEIKKIILTASGGPFAAKSLSELEEVTPEAALKHPNWEMGNKITIDSATLMNKGLEVIEARWLFDIPVEQIEVLLHPQSIVHSMVELVDGSVMAQMSVPDMKGPISYALSYPQRLGNVLPSLDLTSIGTLTFDKPDRDKYRSLALTYDALEAGGTMPSVLNAANEIAVQAFLDLRISFTDITGVVADTMERHRVGKGTTLEEIINSSNWAKSEAEELIRKKWERCRSN